MKKLFISLLLFISVLFLSHAAMAELNIGAEVRVRGNKTDSTDYYASRSSTSPLISSDSYFTQRTRVYLTGDLSKGVSVNTKFQEIGRWNNTSTLFFENAYIKLSKLKPFSSENISIDLLVGRQPIEYGNGLVICDADSASGFNAVKAAVTFKKDASLDIFSIFNSTSATILGGVFNKIWQPDRLKQFIYLIYQSKIFENGLFIGSRVDVTPRKDVRYNVEVAKELSGNGLGIDADIDLKSQGDKYLVSAGLLYGNLNFSLDTSYIKHEEYGEYYITNRLDTPNSNNRLKNLGIIKLGLKYIAVKDLQLGINMFNYKEDGNNSFFNAMIFNAATFDIGLEYNLFARYKYTANTFFRLVYAIFYPGKLAKFSTSDTIKGDVAHKILLECIAKF